MIPLDQRRSAARRFRGGRTRARPRHRVVACLLALWASAAFAQSTLAPLRGLPADTRYETVLEGGAIEGHGVDIARLTSPRPPEVLLEALSQAWQAEHGAAVVRARVGPWAVLSVRDPAGFLGVQLRALPGGASEGLITRWRAGAAPSRPKLDLASVLPSSATPLRQFSSTDAGRRSITLVAWTNGPVASVADHVEQGLRAQGLVPARPRASGDRGIAAQYRGRGLEVAFTVTPHGGRAGLVLHLTETRE